MLSLLLNILPRQPMLYNLEDIVDLFLRQWFAFRNVVPFCQTAPAASPRCVLGDKDRVVPHRCLPTVVIWIGIGQPLRNKIQGVLEDCIQTLISEIFRFLAGKPKSTSKFRPS